MQVLGDFEIRDVLGRGGMGTVYRAWQRSLQRFVALKVLDQRTSVSPAAVARFQREAQAAAKLHHTYIVPIFAQGEDQGFYYYAMELVEGESLADVIARTAAHQTADTATVDLDETVLLDRSGSRPAARSGTSSGPAPDVSDGADSGVHINSVSGAPESDEDFRNIATQMADIADALAYAHEHGVIHRDIKPHNLLLGEDGRLRVSDFGLARLAEQPGVTLTGEVLGSPLYMSREQITGEVADVDHRTDIYSLGATMYEWLTLRPPYPGETRERVIAKIISGDAPPPREHNPHIPVDLETICLRAIEQDRNRRYPNAAQLRDDLRSFVMKKPIQARRAGRVTRALKFIRRHQIASLATAAGVIVVILAVALTSTRSAVRDQTTELDAAQEENAELINLLSAIPFADTITPSVGQAIGGLMSDKGSSGANGSEGAAAAQDTSVGTPKSIAKGVLSEFYTAVVPKDWPPPGDPNDAKSKLLANAMARWKEHDLDTATVLVEAHIQDNPDDFLAVQFHAALGVEAGNYELAAKDGQRMIDLKPDSANAHIWHGLAKLMLPNGLWDAVDSLTRAVELNESSVWAKVAKGLALIVDVRAMGAQLEFEDALRLSPGFEPAVLGYASAFNAQGRFEDALPLVNSVLKIDPKNADALAIRGDCHMALYEYAAAADDFDAAIAVAGQDSWLAWRALAARVQQSRAAQRPAQDTASAAKTESDNRSATSESKLPVVDWLQKLVWPKANPDGVGDGRSKLRIPHITWPGGLLRY